jgi:pimeloyl-ACP methyl ester carboxylesterase
MGHRDNAETGGFMGERVFAARADIRYVLQLATAPAEGLVVAFSSAQAAGAPPRYRWHQILSELPCHRLFVLDDHGLPGPLPGPSWYLGPHRSDVAGSVCDLIEQIAAELEVDRARTVMIGSSMGGWAALYFAARAGGGHAIAAEPQTRLGDYLCGPAFHRIAEHVVGGSSPEHRRRLDGMLFAALRAAPSPPKVHLYCGRDSPYYERHVMPLLSVLGELGAESAVELGEFSDHGDLAGHFGAYLLRCLDDVMARGRAD